MQRFANVRICSTELLFNYCTGLRQVKVEVRQDCRRFLFSDNPIVNRREMFLLQSEAVADYGLIIQNGRTYQILQSMTLAGHVCDHVKRLDRLLA